MSLPKLPLQALVVTGDCGEMSGGNSRVGRVYFFLRKVMLGDSVGDAYTDSTIGVFFTVGYNQLLSENTAEK